MRFIHFRAAERRGLAVAAGGRAYLGLFADDPNYPGDLMDLLRGGEAALKSAVRVLSGGKPVDLTKVEYLPPIASPEKIICIGLNYADHSAESGFKVPDYPTVFGRYSSTFVGHGSPLVRPKVSTELDYEGELVAVIGRGGRHIPLASALDHVAGYSIFNDASVRDYQFKTPQWTIGKNFDGTGAFGPAFVSADELPLGCKGLRLQTRLNGTVLQSASTDDMIFNVASLVSILSEAMTLSVGDIIVTGTPAGIGAFRNPKLFMKPGDVCEIEIEQVGLLRNPIVDEAARATDGDIAKKSAQGALA
jgi:2-keto-4-pentenoate hydratase/2-oxohepta-3-ene-1,7-dioic acid hydratase in catechol pathway